MKRVQHWVCVLDVKNVCFGLSLRALLLGAPLALIGQAGGRRGATIIRAVQPIMPRGAAAGASGVRIARRYFVTLRLGSGAAAVSAKRSEMLRWRLVGDSRIAMATKDVQVTVRLSCIVCCHIAAGT